MAPSAPRRPRALANPAAPARGPGGSRLHASESTRRATRSPRVRAAGRTDSPWLVSPPPDTCARPQLSPGGSGDGGPRAPAAAQPSGAGPGGCKGLRRGDCARRWPSHPPIRVISIHPSHLPLSEFPPPAHRTAPSPRAAARESVRGDGLRRGQRHRRDGAGAARRADCGPSGRAKLPWGPNLMRMH